jgi:hypothetical protein
MKRPSFQFYPGDWLNDAALRTVSVPARGLWIEMICLMHQGSDYGYLKVNHKVILIPNLARMVGATLDETEAWIAELDSAGVFGRDADGCIFSKRMIRDEEVRSARAAGGKLGGNPALKGKSKVNLPANLPPTPSSSSSSSSSIKDQLPMSSGDDVRQCPTGTLVNLYHELMPNNPQVKVLNAARKSAIKARWNEASKLDCEPFGYSTVDAGVEAWRQFFVVCAASKFLTGLSPPRPGHPAFVADIDFLFSPSGFAKTLENKYHQDAP